ncbi:hypothetical protein Echvi_0706 [Echinicola vietnamensis DSM 17526]|uniref:Uncharacterized protein n=1 Tax=Echinicola vietnamensis (strain DSM 17526 / LMG 23754 / KMM 6221) TaxID=926556 RepID=L0FVD5_ECHVK|nr:hypothetical protein Echvi_0706 [Echinicola vietnamensis DSM 17526]
MLRINFSNALNKAIYPVSNGILPYQFEGDVMV